MNCYFKHKPLDKVILIFLSLSLSLFISTGRYILLCIFLFIYILYKLIYYFKIRCIILFIKKNIDIYLYKYFRKINKKYRYLCWRFDNWNKKRNWKNKHRKPKIWFKWLIKIFSFLGVLLYISYIIYWYTNICSLAVQLCSTLILNIAYIMFIICYLVLLIPIFIIEWVKSFFQGGSSFSDLSDLFLSDPPYYPHECDKNFSRILCPTERPTERRIPTIQDIHSRRIDRLLFPGENATSIERRISSHIHEIFTLDKATEQRMGIYELMHPPVNCTDYQLEMKLRLCEVADTTVRPTHVSGGWHGLETHLQYIFLSIKENESELRTSLQELRALEISGPQLPGDNLHPSAQSGLQNQVFDRSTRSQRTSNIYRFNFNRERSLSPLTDTINQQNYRSRFTGMEGIPRHQQGAVSAPQYVPQHFQHLNTPLHHQPISQQTTYLVDSQSNYALQAIEAPIQGAGQGLQQVLDESPGSLHGPQGLQDFMEAMSNGTINRTPLYNGNLRTGSVENPLRYAEESGWQKITGGFVFVHEDGPYYRRIKGIQIDVNGWQLRGESLNSFSWQNKIINKNLAAIFYELKAVGFRTLRADNFYRDEPGGYTIINYLNGYRDSMCLQPIETLSYRGMNLDYRMINRLADSAG